MPFFAACTSGTVVVDEAPDWSASAPVDACERTICLTGAVDQTSGSNHYFTRLCGAYPMPGLVEDCDSGECYRTHDTFPGGASAPYEALFAAMDEDGDGAVGGDDRLCELNLIGFSWGGVNALELARMLQRDERVAPSHRRVGRVLVMDPYKPFAGSAMSVPANVAETWVWRHSVAPERNCSSIAPLGPYTGLPARCDAEQVCHDVDFSMRPDERLVGPGFSSLGKDVDHCDVPGAATQEILSILGMSGSTATF